MCKVLFLGAGACKDAGLPLAGELINEIIQITNAQGETKNRLGQIKNFFPIKVICLENYLIIWSKMLNSFLHLLISCLMLHQFCRKK